MESIRENSNPSTKRGDLPSVGIMLSEAWHIVLTRWLTLAILSVLPFFSLLLVAPVVFLFEAGVTWYVCIPLFLLVLIVIILAFTVFGLAQYIVIVTDQPSTISQALSSAKSKIWSYMWVGGLVGFLVLGAFLLFFVPGIVLAFWFSQVAYVFIVEGDKGFSALLKSREYVRGNFWRILWRGFILILIAIVFGSFLAILQSIGGFFDQAIGLSVFEYAFGFVNLLFNVAFGFFGMAFYFVLYKGLKESTGQVKVIATRGRKLKYSAVSITGYALLIGIITVALIWG